MQSVLIANRGEIACRITRTLQQLGLRAIAVCSEADRGAPHTLFADEVVEIGPAPVDQSYLSISRIIDAARASNAHAIHPGYGFLSENAEFAQAVSDAGLIFIGPPVAAIAAMGNKAQAKRLMLGAGVPCVPGYHDPDQSDESLLRAAAQLDYPLMIKAAAGGGGRGMRLVERESTLRDDIAVARSEALAAFGSDELILERAVLNARHVEVQVFADSHGNALHLGERDCSVQRRHQKVIEESPCPVMTDGLREEMGQAALAAARAVDYLGAGTVEFLLDQSGQFYFLEMNTRLQVEHPVTEMVTGLDLVALQIAIANGEPLPIEQQDVAIDGHAIEVRLYAEDPGNSFLPVTGKIEHWSAADATLVRTDAGIASGLQISPYYDPMLAKVIAHGQTREIARRKLIRGLQQTCLLGPTTNAGLLVSMLEHRDFVEGQADTSFIATRYADGLSAPVPHTHELAVIAALCLYREQQWAFAKATGVSENLLGWTSSVMRSVPLELSIHDQRYSFAIDCRADRWQVRIDDADQTIEVILDPADEVTFRATVDGVRLDAGFIGGANDRYYFSAGVRHFVVDRIDRVAASLDRAASGDVLAPMPGTLVALQAQCGQTVKKGDTLAVLEAMKMQHRITAPVDGCVAELPCKQGDQLATGALIARIEETTRQEQH
jgi:geranyl-CoA carboxylase alpha subunit